MAGFIPFKPGDAHAKKHIPKGKPTDRYIKSKYGRNTSGEPGARSTYNPRKKHGKYGKARTTERMQRAAQRRLTNARD